MKRVRRCMTIAIMMFSLMMPVTAFASSQSGEETAQAEPRTTESVEVPDPAGNRYRLRGTVYRTQRVGQVETAFEIIQYAESNGNYKNTINNLEKSCNAYAEVYLNGGGKNSIMKNQALRGASGSSQATEYFIYDIWTIEGTHFFASNGLRQTFFSSM